MIVRQGSAEVSTPQGSAQVDAGQMITIAGTDNPQYKTEAAPGNDDWDTWNDDRDHRITSASSWGKTDRYYTGSEDLDTYGTWSEVPDYGPVWIPSGTGPDWAPYRMAAGFISPIMAGPGFRLSPWGWAPYHYGRWIVYGNSWAWWPGPVVGYPATIRSGRRRMSPSLASAEAALDSELVSASGFGRFGWLPCGPGDWYHPWYGHDGGSENVVQRHEHQ